MRDLIILIVHLITTVLRLVRPGGLRAVIAESVIVKHQLLILSRSRRRAPNLRILDRLIAGAGSAEVSVVVFTEAENETRTEGSRHGSHSCRRRNETAPSDMGMSANR